MPTNDFNAAVLNRAKTDLKMFQSNVIVHLEDGSQLRGIWEGNRFVDFMDGEPMQGVLDYEIDDRLPEGGFSPNQFALRL